MEPTEYNTPETAETPNAAASLITGVRNTAAYSRALLAAVNVNLKTTSYVLGAIGVMLVANAIDQIPVVGSLTSFVGLFSIGTFCSDAEKRAKFKTRVQALVNDVFGEDAPEIEF